MEYFSHNSNTRNKEELIRLRRDLDWAGYGLYWAIMEKLGEAPDGMIRADCSLLAWDLRSDEEVIRKIVSDYGLFSQTEEGMLYSETILENMAQRNERSTKARQSVKRRWGKKEVEGQGCVPEIPPDNEPVAYDCNTSEEPAPYERNTNVLPAQNECNTIKYNEIEYNKKENSTEVELKKSNRFSPPSLAEVQKYVLERGSNVSAQRFVDFYQSKNWMIGKNKMKDWRAAVRTWEQKEGSFARPREPNGSAPKQGAFEIAGNLMQENPFE